jgi:hypothetical protein
MQENIKQVNGSTVQVNAGAVGTGSQRVAVVQDTTTIAGSAPGTTPSPSANILTVQGNAGVSLVIGGARREGARPRSRSGLLADGISVVSSALFTVV